MKDKNTMSDNDGNIEKFLGDILDDLLGLLKEKMQAKTAQNLGKHHMRQRRARGRWGLVVLLVVAAAVRRAQLVGSLTSHPRYHASSQQHTTFITHD